MGPWTFISLVGLAFLVWFVLVFLFTPRIDYHLTGPLADEAQLLRVLQEECQARLHTGNCAAVLTNGTQFYPAMLAAIREAHHSINVEAYIFEPGEIVDQVVAALAERAKAGVEVRIVLDAIGSSHMRTLGRGLPADRGRLPAPLLPAADVVPAPSRQQPHPPRAAHRGRAGRVRRRCRCGGLVVRPSSPEEPAWRDTMVRVEGPVVASLQGVFAENWLECEGEILTSPACWPPLGSAGPVDAMLIRSSPADRATASRVGFQLLMSLARDTIDISTPYFLPDFTLRRFLMETAARGVRIRVIVPGPRTDQRFVRLASRRLYGPCSRRAFASTSTSPA